MKKTITVCDHCGRELRSNGLDYEETDIEVLNLFTADLCVDCITELDEYVNEFLKTGHKAGREVSE